jgi:hypothetical protein
MLSCFVTSYARVRVMSRGAPQHLVVAMDENAISWVSILAAAVYIYPHNPRCSAYFRRHSTAFRQEIRSLLHSAFTAIPQIFRAFSA